jgi:hypothetical protein
MTRPTWFAAPLALAVIAVSVNAGTIPEKTMEIEGRGSFSHDSFSAAGDDVGSTTEMNLSGTVGYAVTNAIQVVGGLQFQRASASPEGGDSSSFSGYGARAGARYNFTTQSSIVPFVEAGMSFLAWSGDGYEDAKTTMGLPYVGGGARLLIGNSASINFGGQFERTTNALGVEDMDSNSFGFYTGISVFPGGLSQRTN